MLATVLRLFQTQVHAKAKVADLGEIIRWSPPTGGSKGRVLLSYLKSALSEPLSIDRLNGHSNLWECRRMAELLVERGFTVDGIDFGNTNFRTCEKYDVVIDIYSNLKRLEHAVRLGGLKLLHMTGSEYFFQNNAEKTQISSMLARKRAASYTPKRTVLDPAAARASLDAADFCSLIGNEVTLKTYPKEYHPKINCITVSGSYPRHSRSPESLSKKNEFLWFFGSGAVHKGLDLVLEAFAGHPALILNVVGNVAHENDFWKIYKRELTALHNIRYWGFQTANSLKFRWATRNVFAVVGPSCSEGISPAIATAMQIGFLPVISRETGITLPGAGIYIDSLTVPAVRESCERALSLTTRERLDQISKTQSYSLCEYSREEFSKRMGAYFDKVLTRLQPSKTVLYES